jgi:hypothetical protein
MKTKIGRPKLPKGRAKGVLMAVRVAEADESVIAQAIKRSGQKKAEWLRGALLAAATQKLVL